MKETVMERHACRTIDLMKMFHGIANAIRVHGKEAVYFSTRDGVSYRFRIGNKVCTYTVQEGGEL